MLKVQMLTALSMPVYLTASFVGLLDISKKGFQVTPKGNTNKVPLKNLWPQLLVLAVVFATLVLGITKLYYQWNYVLMINVFWMGLQFVMLFGIFHFNKK